MGYWDKRENKPNLQEQTSGNLAELEAECEQELEQVHASFRDRMKAENDRFRDMCDTEYWVCVCFTSRTQREEFLKSVGFDPDEKYVDGKALAKAIKRPINSPDLKFSKVRPFDKQYLERSMPV